MKPENKPIMCDTLENIERVMLALHVEYAKPRTIPGMVTPILIAPFAEALATIARELIELRQSLEQPKTS